MRDDEDRRLTIDEKRGEKRREEKRKEEKRRQLAKTLVFSYQFIVKMPSELYSGYLFIP